MATAEPCDPTTTVGIDKGNMVIAVENMLLVSQIIGKFNCLEKQTRRM